MYSRILVFTFSVLLSLSVFAQPQYYNNASSKGSETASPLYGGGMDKAQWVFGPGTFKSAGTSGTAAKAGKIENIYFMLGSKIFDPQLYEFTVKLGQNVGTDTVWADTTWNTGMTTVYYRAERKVTDAQWAWIQIPLQEHFVYNPNLSLVLEMSMTSGHGATIRGHIVSGKVSINGLLEESTGRSNLGLLPNFGFDMTDTDPYNAGVSKLTGPLYFCDGMHDVKVDIVNNGAKPLDSVRINWSIDGMAQPVIYYKNSIDTFEGSGANRVNVTLGPVAFPTGVKKDIKVWTSHPNGVQDSTNEDDTLAASFMPALNGNYTIGGTGADFASFSDAATYLNNYGVCGPVKLKAAAGTYKEQLILKRIGGVSATNTITIEGSGRTNTIIEHKGTDRNNWQTVLLHGVNYLTLKNLTIEAQDSTWAIGIHLIDADHNTIDSCDIILHDNSYSVKLYGIAGSGTPWETLTGNSGNYNTFSNLNIRGGYIGINYAGPNAFILSIGNKFIKNSITGYLREGINLLGHGKVTIDSNYIANRTDQYATSWGLYLSAVADFSVTRNVIHTKNIGMDIYFPNYYYRYSNPYGNMSNNMVVSNATIRFHYARHVKLYHNTFSVPASGGGCLSIWWSDTLDIQNNIFKNLAKYGIIYFYCSNIAAMTIDNNIYYDPDPPTCPIVEECTTVDCYTSLSNWFSYVPALNKNSRVEEPKFISSTDLHLENGYRPTGPNLGIMEDIDENPRCLLSPTIGAHEVIRGTVPDTTDPDNLCAGDTIGYALQPPQGMQNSDFGTKWTINALKFETASGTQAKNYTLTYPSGSTNGSIKFHPNTDDADSSYFLSLAFENLVNKGCDSVFGKYIKVFPKPKAAFTLSKSVICLGDSIVLTNNSSASQSIKYLWYMGDNVEVSSSSFTYRYEEGGIFPIKLVAFTPGCLDSTSQTVTVYGTNGAEIIKGEPFNGFMQTGTMNDPDNLCAGDTLTYEISPPGGFTNAQYNTYWRVSMAELKTMDGTTISDTLTTLPDSNTNFKFRFIAGSQLSGDTLILSVTLSTVTVSCNDTKLTRYLVLGHSPKVALGYKLTCFGQGPIAFYDSSTIASGAVARLWDFGDGSFSTAKNISHTYKQPGTYNVTLEVTSNTGCTNKLTKAIHVSEPPQVGFAYQEQCSGFPSSFFDSTVTSENIASRQWKFGDGTTDTGKNPTHVYAAGGAYNVTLVVQTVSGCSDSITRKISVQESPSADFSYSNACLNEPVMFTNTSKNPASSSVSYTWDFGDGNKSDSTNPVHVFSGFGKFNVELIATLSNGCSDTTVHEVTVHNIPGVAFGLNSMNACKGIEAEFIDSTIASGAQYYWDFGDGDRSTNKAGKHIYIKTGTYKVMLKVTSVNGCADSAFRQINVMEQPVAGFTMDTACINTPTSFSNTSAIASGATFFWEFGDGATSTDKNPVHTYANTGSFQTKLTVTDPSKCEDLKTRAVTVYPLPSAAFTISHVSAIQKQFMPSDSSHLSYLWFFGDGDSSVAVSPVHTYPQGNGNYQVKLIATNKEGCRAEHSELIKIDVGIQEVSADDYSLSIYPNPFTQSTFLNFTLENSSMVRIELTDIHGRKIETLEHGRKGSGKHNYEINAHKLGMAPGIYNLQMYLGDSHITRRIILN